MGAINHRVALSQLVVGAHLLRNHSPGPIADLRLERLQIRVSAGVCDPPNTSVDRASSCFQLVIWAGWILNCLANSAGVLSTLMAATTTGALKGRPVIPLVRSHCLAPFVDHPSGG